jgi:hypothetical protein
VTEKEEEILRSEEGFWNTGLLLFERLQRSLNFARRYVEPCLTAKELKK